MKLTIKPCRGEFNCWLKTPGKCFQKDDMQMLLPKLFEGDIWVLATPLYVDGVSGPMKMLLDRLIPFLYPFIETRDGHCRHPDREGYNRGKLVLVSNCGFWETDNFDPLLVHMKAICKNIRREFAGALLRPHGPAVKGMIEMGMPPNDLFEAAKKAGGQLVNNGEMSTETLSIISRNLMTMEDYQKVANDIFQGSLDSLQKK